MNDLRKYFLQFLLWIKNNSEKFSKKNEAPKHKELKTSVTKGTVGVGVSLQIKTNLDELKKEVENISLKFVKKYYGDTEKTLSLLEKKGAKIYRSQFAVKLLKNINEKQGFITPLKGFKGFYVNFMFSLLCDGTFNFDTNSKEMFIFPKKEIDTYFLAAQIYRFVAFKKKMPGFEYDVQEKFKKLYKRPNSKNFSELTAGDIFALKEAIARDVESADFAIKLSEESNAGNKISNNNTQN